MWINREILQNPLQLNRRIRTSHEDRMYLAKVINLMIWCVSWLFLSKNVTKILRIMIAFFVFSDMIVKDYKREFMKVVFMITAA